MIEPGPGCLPWPPCNSWRGCDQQQPQFLSCNCRAGDPDCGSASCCCITVTIQSWTLRNMQIFILFSHFSLKYLHICNLDRGWGLMKGLVILGANFEQFGDFWENWLENSFIFAPPNWDQVLQSKHFTRIKLEWECLTQSSLNDHFLN